MASDLIILAAGLGTRFLPASKTIPKEMLPIGIKPTIQYIVEEAISSGIEEIAIVISSFGIEFIYQDEAKGLGHAILCPKEFINEEPFAVLLGDDVVMSDMPCLKQLIHVYNEKRESVVGVQAVNPEQTERYSIIDTNGK